eukprot:9909846-Alexandrium_andersonii.AAC.1
MAHPDAKQLAPATCHALAYPCLRPSIAATWRCQPPQWHGSTGSSVARGCPRWPGCAAGRRAAEAPRA